MSTSKCIYCDSTSYGKPCLFSPTNTHVHMSDPGRCIYCGGKYKGHGCSFNPYGKVHISAPEFLNRNNVKTEKAMLLHYFLGKTHSPEILGENYKSPLDRFYKRFKSIVIHLTMPLYESLMLSETNILASVKKEQLTNSLIFKNKFKKIFEELNSLINQAHQKLPPEMVEEALLKGILSKDET